MSEVHIKNFKRVLVANRGEIAIRVFRALNELGITSVAVYSKEDKYAMFRTLADEAYALNPEKGPVDAYLDIPTIIKIAKDHNVDAIHPGYGFLAENPILVEECAKNGIVFIGPTVESMNAMGDKISSKQIAIASDVPIIPGVDHAIKTTKEALEVAEKVGYPVMLKASNGGGGRGMRIVNKAEDMPKEFKEAIDESKKAFGDDQVFIEKYLRGPKHVEVQVLADNYGNVVHLYDRDCSVQRRHQKLIEESPSAFVTPELREKMTSAAVALAKRVGYRNAGTIEFLVDNDRNFYFCEMNTRIQVEHPVTEEVTGVDLVCEQLRVAAGEPLSFKQEDLTIRGHAIECRINAEDPSRNFAPCPGTLVSLHLPGGPGVRVDSAAYQGYKIPPFYDSMIGKLIVYGADREQAIVRMRRALAEMLFEGVVTATDYQMHILCSKAFVEANFNVNSIANGDFD